MIILHYIPSIDQNSGGVGAYLKLLAHSLGKIAELHIVTHHSENELDIENSIIHYIEHSLKKVLVAREQFIELLDEITPDIVHVNSCWEPLSSFTVFWAKKKGYPVLLTPHGMLEPWVLKKNHWKKKIPALILYQRRSLKMADALIATAESERLNIANLKYNSNVLLVPNGIVVDGIEMKNTWKRTKTILYMGLLRPNKGAGVLLDALSLIKEHLCGYRVVIAGPDTEGYLSVLMKKAEDKGLDNIVSFPGGVFGDEKWRLYQHADVFVLPTLNENFGIVIAEALLSGTPVVTCKGAPWKGLVEHNCGWWVNRTPEDVATAILKSLQCSEKKLEQMGRHGRTYVVDNFSSDIVAKKMLDVYKNICRDR